MDHRRTINRKVFVPPVWLLGVTIAAIVLGAAGLGWIVWDRYGEDGPATTASPTAAPAPEESSEPTPEPTVEPTPTPAPTPTPSPTPSPTPVVERTAGVSVLNNTRVQGLAAKGAAAVRTKGWSNVATGNWRGSVAGNTVYHPPALADEAQLLAADLGITRVQPAVTGMRGDRLTVILADPSSSFP